ncbi:hypothetical protein ACMFMG_002571 [Clarireedia jacksonii]
MRGSQIKQCVSRCTFDAFTIPAWRSHPISSDNEPLLPSHHRSTLSNHPFAPHTYSQHMYAAPQFCNTRLTDDSIIPAIVIDVIPKDVEHHETSDDDKNHHGRRTSLLRRVIHKEKKDKEKSVEHDGPRRITKVVYMPRRDYYKWFARGQGGEYIGTEPHKRWTEEELETTFGRYRPPVNRRTGMFWGRG